MSVDSLCKTVECVDCKCTESSFWHKSNGSAICTTCYCRRDSLNRSTRSQGLLSSNSTSATSKAAADESHSSDNSVSVVRSGSASITRKSSRLKPLTKNRAWQNVVKPSATKGRSRRFIFKKNVIMNLFFCVKSLHIAVYNSNWKQIQLLRILLWLTEWQLSED